MSDFTFFTNEPGKKGIDRFKTLFNDTKELNIIVGYFYLSGLYQLMEDLEKVDRIRIIVGMHVGRGVFDLINVARTVEDSKNRYLDDIVNELSSSEWEDSLANEITIRWSWMAEPHNSD